MADQTISKTQKWISYILQGIIVLMFVMGGVMNLIMNEDAVKSAVDLGYAEGQVHYLGAILLICTLLYAIPKTVKIGAILLTGWLGGAIATHMIHGDPLFSSILPVIFGVVVWGALWLRKADGIL